MNEALAWARKGVFHGLMAPSGLPLAVFVAVLWTAIFLNLRPAFSGLFQSRLQPRI